MDRYNYGTTANSFVNGLMRGYSFGRGIRNDQAQQQKDQRDQAWQDEQRQHQRGEWGYQDATRETPEQIAARRAQEAEGRTLDQKIKQNSLATAETPEQAAERRRLDLQSKRTGIAASRESIATSRQNRGDKSQDRQNEDVRNHVRGALEAIKADWTKPFDNPQVQQTAVDAWEAVSKGQMRQGITAPQLYDYASVLFKPELDHGVGSKLSNGDTVVSKRIVAARRKGDKIVLELGIKAKKPDGTEYEYNAPVTKNRTDSDTDEVLELPLDPIMRRFAMGKTMATTFASTPGGRDGLIAHLRQQYAEHGGDPSKLSPKVKRGLQEVKTGDQIQTYQTQDGQLVGAPIATAERFNPNGFPMGMFGTGQGGQPAVTKPADSVPSDMTPIGQTPDGRPVYQDAQGNRFVGN